MDHHQSSVKEEETPVRPSIESTQSIPTSRASQRPETPDKQSETSEREISKGETTIHQTTVLQSHSNDLSSWSIRPQTSASDHKADLNSESTSTSITAITNESSGEEGKGADVGLFVGVVVAVVVVIVIIVVLVWLLVFRKKKDDDSLSSDLGQEHEFDMEINNTEATNTATIFDDGLGHVLDHVPEGKLFSDSSFSGNFEEEEEPRDLFI